MVIIGLLAVFFITLEERPEIIFFGIEILICLGFAYFIGYSILTAFVGS